MINCRPLKNKNNFELVERRRTEPSNPKNLKKTNKLSTNFEPTPYTVVQVYQRSVKIQHKSGKTFVRNKCHVKHYLEAEQNTSHPFIQSSFPKAPVAPSPASWPLVLEEEPEPIGEEIHQPVGEDEILELSQGIENISLQLDSSDDEHSELEETVAYADETALPRYPQRDRRVPQHLTDFDLVTDFE